MTLAIIFLISIILSGNKMPLILFCFATIIFFCILFYKNWIKLIIFFLSIFFIFLFLFKTNEVVKINYSNFYNQVNNLIKIFITKKINIKEEVELKNLPYVLEFSCFNEKFKIKPIFGGGLRSYRAELGCNTHPHNYYFEILVDLGSIGLLIFIIMIYSICRLIYCNKSLFLGNKINFYYKVPFIIILLIEFFPIRSTGSLFTTGNSSFIFLIIAILVSTIYNERKNYKKIKI